jgi:hypothetical protein
MVCTLRIKETDMIRFTAVAALVLSMLMPSAPAFAQSGTPLVPRQTDEQRVERPHSLRDSVARYDFTAVPGAGSSQTPAFQPTSVRSERSMTRKIFGGLLGATAGFFGGGYLGAKIEGDGCSCDDPGLKGAIIGAPIGAVVGAIVGTLLF